MLFVVSGPSGSGKSTLIGRVRRRLPDLEFSVSHTTREPRPSEREGVDYHFVPERTFERMIRDRRFVEWARVHGRLYGTSKAELERKARRGDVVLDIDVQGARQVRKKIPRAILIFIMPPVFTELRKRLGRRKADSPEAIERRLRDAAAEVRAYRGFDFVVVNDDLEQAASELGSVIVAARRRTGAMAGALRPVLRSFASRPKSGRKRGRA
jgi:guanylate kinase